MVELFRDTHTRMCLCVKGGLDMAAEKIPFKLVTADGTDSRHFTAVHD